MALMGLGVKCGDTVTVTIEGEDEDTCAPMIEAFFNENF
jgi:phosphocarrier protein